ncbi:MAG: hypothetical protein MUF06_22385 [Pirellulaceae bacterium]|nr:hypothetical protein [Pirellulaceae bacterium]
MSFHIHHYCTRGKALLAACSQGLVAAGLAALLAMIPLTAAQAQIPAGPGNIATAETTGVTLYQVNGLNGKIPLKKVWKVHPSGDSGQYVLEFASPNMNTKMNFKAKFAMPDGMVFTSFEVSSHNGPQQVTTAGADSWDGQTLIDEVTVSPWNMNRVLQQCIDHLSNPDGTFKNSATFDLVASETEYVRGKGICKHPNAPPGAASSFSGKVKPKTRVEAYIVSEDRRGADTRDSARLSSSGSASRPTADQPTRRPLPGRPSVGKPATDIPATRVPTTRVPHTQIPPRRVPQTSSAIPAAGGRLVAGTPQSSFAKEKFQRTKPHVNASSSLPKPSGQDPNRPSRPANR